MKLRTLVAAGTILSLLTTLNPRLSAAPLGTALTYQGRLDDAGGATGLHNFSFNLWDAETGGAPVGLSLVKWAVPVANGLFTVSLDLTTVFAADATWPAIGVMPLGTSTFIALTPAPHALYAPSAGNAVLATTDAGDFIHHSNQDKERNCQKGHCS